MLRINFFQHHLSPSSIGQGHIYTHNERCSGVFWKCPDLMDYSTEDMMCQAVLNLVQSFKDKGSFPKNPLNKKQPEINRNDKAPLWAFK